MWLFNLLSAVWLDQRGDVTDPVIDADGGQGDNTPADGQGDAPSETDGQGQGEETPPPTPKYGEFGDEPDVDTLFSKYNEVSESLENMKGKMTATERNSAALRRTLESSGIRVLKDADGNIHLQPIEKTEQTDKQRRFTDAHKSLFDPQVFDALEAFVQDKFEDLFDNNFNSKFEKKQQETTQNIRTRARANSQMVDLFPSITPKLSDGKDNPDFNEAFHIRATEIWQNTDDYKKHPKGELWATMDAAAELGISSTSIKNLEQAKKDGFQQGKTSKKVLGPVSTSADGASKGGGKLSEAEYLKLTDEERDAYDKKQLGI